MKSNLSWRYYQSNERKRNILPSSNTLNKSIKEEFTSSNENSSQGQPNQKMISSSSKGVISSTKSQKDLKNEEKEKSKNEGQKPTMETQG